MIKCSKTTLKYSNTHKTQKLHLFIDEYQRVVKELINLLWTKDSIHKFIQKEELNQINSWLSKRALQCAGKQASGIIRGTRKKQQKREYIHNKLISEGKFKQARKLKRVMDQVKISKPDINSLEIELDSRFVTLDWNNSTSFDGWLTLSSLGNKLKIQIPLKRTKHFNLLHKQGVLKSGARLSKDKVTFNFDIPKIEPKTKGIVLGVDIGSKKTISCSNGFQSKADKHGWDLDRIQTKLSRKKKGSKRFAKAQQHRTNYINWSINQLDVSDVQKIRIENIKNLRKNSRSSRKLSHWTYTAIFDKLEDLCSSTGVQLERVNPAYTSQRCSQCGWVRERNRQGELFKCTSCFYECDSDLNASKNISFELSRISEVQRLSGANKVGFYWF